MVLRRGTPTGHRRTAAASSRRRSLRLGHRGATTMALCALLPGFFAACSGSGGGGSGPTSASQDAPRIVAVDWIDVDQNGADADDVLMLQFDREVVLQGNDVVGVAAVSDGDSLGDGPW